MKYLNITIFVAFVFVIGTGIYYSKQIREIDKDFSQNYWLNPKNPVLASYYTEYSYIGRVVDSAYEGASLRIKISGVNGERDFLLSEGQAGEYLQNIDKSNTVLIIVASYPGGYEQVNRLSFFENVE